MFLKLDEVFSGYTSEIDIVQGVSFEAEKGEITCLIGPNGAGKSTVLKTIYGLLRARKGKITFEGEEITGMECNQILKRGLSYIPQGRVIFPGMTIQENLEMAAFTRNDNGIKRDIETVLERFPVLEEKRRESAGTLSGGQQQVLAIGMALMLHPKMMLLDEPSLGLAPIVVSDIFHMIENMKKEGLTIILVEQNARKALSIADHAIVLELGRKRFEGTGEEILNNELVKRLYLGG